MNNLLIGDWQVDFSSGVCHRLNPADPAQPGATMRLEPKSCQLLHYLACRPGQLVSKEQLAAAVWPDSYASDDTLARTVSRLRTSLDDDARQPRYIETVPKRGYQLIAAVSQYTTAAANATVSPLASRWRRAAWLAVALLLVAAAGYQLSSGLWQAAPSPNQKNLLSRADDYYHQMRLADNEMAIALYQQHINQHPRSGEAYAGLANSLVQKTIRWSGGNDNQTTLTSKVAAGALADDTSQQQLQRAHALASQAVALQPDSAVTLKALGFVLSAQGQYQDAIAIYQQALQADPNAWQVQLNIGELYQATGDMPRALQAYEAAFQAMSDRYTLQEVQIRPWITEVGSMLGDHYLAAADYPTAEQWYRRVISLAPLHEAATLGLAKVLHATGDSNAALQLCKQLNQRLQQDYQCQQLLTEPQNQ